MKIKTFILTFLLMMMSSPIIFGQNQTRVRDFGELRDAINRGDSEIELASTITVSESLTVQEGFTITLDLNGWGLSAAQGTYVITNYGNLTIKDDFNGQGFVKGRGILNGKSTESTVASLTIESGIYRGIANAGAAVYNQEYGKVTITGGEFYGKQAAIVNRGNMDIKCDPLQQELLIVAEGDKNIAIINFGSQTSTLNIEGETVIVGTIDERGEGQANVDEKVIFAQARVVSNSNITYHETLEDAFNKATNGDTVEIFFAGTYALKTSGKNITITGLSDGVVFDNIGAMGMGGASVTFNNVTFDYYPNVNYTGLQHSGNLVYNNCTFNGQPFLYGTSEEFNNCTFNQESSDAYNVWTYGAKKVAFNECTFNSAGKSVLIYSEDGSLFNNVEVTKCKFIASTSVVGKAAIEMDSSLTAGIKLTIDGETTAEGFDAGSVSDNSLWNNKKGSAGDNNDITVVVDGITVLEPHYSVELNGTKYENLQNALAAVTAGDNIITLLENNTEGDVTINQTEGINITIDGGETTRYDFAGTMYIVGNNRYNGQETLKFINIDFNKETITDNHDYISSNSQNAPIRYAHNVTIENCNFTAPADTEHDVVAMRFRQAYNIKVIGGEFSNLHSVAWTQGVQSGLSFDGIDVDNCKNGIHIGGGYKNSPYTITDSKLDVDNYGIRVDGDASKDIEINDCEINAKIPVVTRNAKELLNFTFGTNTMTPNNPHDMWFVAGIEEYDGGETLPEIGGQVVVNIDEDSTLGYEGVYGNYGVAKISKTTYNTFAEALNAVQNGETIEVLDFEGSEKDTKIEYTKEIEFNIIGEALDYTLPIVTFKNATVNINNAKIKTAELDARHNATINVNNSTILGHGSDDFVKAKNNGVININGNSVIHTMQLTTFGGTINLNDKAQLNATWQINGHGNGLINVNDEAVLNAAALNLISRVWDNGIHANEDREGEPSTIVVNGATLIVGKVSDEEGTDYSYNSGKYGINIGTYNDGTNTLPGVLDIKNGATVEFYMDPTTNKTYKNPVIGENGTVSISGSSFEVISSKDGQTLALVNNGTVNVYGESTLNIAKLEETEIKLQHGAIIKDSNVGGEATLYGAVTFRGDNTFSMIYDFGGAHSTESATWTVEEGASLTLTDKGRYGLGYGDNATINGNIEEGKALTIRETLTDDDLSLFVHGVAMMDSYNTDNYLTVNNAYVQIGSNNSFGTKDSYGQKGKFHVEFTNSVLTSSRVTIVENGGFAYFNFNGSDILTGVWSSKSANSTVKFENSKMLVTGNGTDYNNANAGEWTMNNSNVKFETGAFTNIGELSIGESSTFESPEVVNSGTINFTGEDAKLVTSTEGLEIVNATENNDIKVVYKDGAYQFVPKHYVAEIVGGAKYESLAEAATAAQNGETIQLLWNEGDEAISMAATFVGNKTVTITGTADVDWDKGWLYVGRNGEGNGKLIFNEANLTSKSVGVNGNGTGLNVSCKEDGDSTTNDGEVEIINSNIQLDYLIGKGNIKLDNSTLNVYEGFAVGARPATEAGGVQRTVTMDITNGSKVIVDNHNGQGLGYESVGIMNIDATSTFETTQSFLITANGTMNVNGGNVKVVGTLTNKGTVNVTGESAVINATVQGEGWFKMSGFALTSTTILNGTNIEFVKGTENTANDLTFGNNTIVDGNLTISTSVTADGEVVGEGNIILDNPDAKFYTSNPDLNVTSGFDGYHAMYNNDDNCYELRDNELYVAHIGDKYFETFEAAIQTATDNDVIELLGKDIAIRSSKPFTASNVRIKGNAAVLWNNWKLEVAEGASLIFDEATLTAKQTTTPNVKHGLHIYGALTILNSNIELDCLALYESGVVNVDNSIFTIKNEHEVPTAGIINVTGISDIIANVSDATLKMENVTLSDATELVLNNAVVEFDGENNEIIGSTFNGGNFNVNAEATVDATAANITSNTTVNGTLNITDANPTLSALTVNGILNVLKSKSEENADNTYTFKVNSNYFYLNGTATFDGVNAETGKVIFGVEGAELNVSERANFVADNAGKNPSMEFNAAATVTVDAKSILTINDNTIVKADNVVMNFDGDVTATGDIEDAPVINMNDKKAVFRTSQTGLTISTNVDDSKVVYNETEKVYVIVEKVYIASVNDDKFETIAEAAVKAAATDAPIVLLANTTEDVTIDDAVVFKTEGEEQIVVSGKLTVNSEVTFEDANVRFTSTGVKANAVLNIGKGTNYSSKTFFTEGTGAMVSVAATASLGVDEKLQFSYSHCTLNISGSVVSNTFNVPDAHTINMNDPIATLETSNNALNVISNVQEHKVSYKNGMYQLVESVVAYVSAENAIDGQEHRYMSFAEALTGVKDGGEIELLWKDNNDPIVMEGALSGKDAVVTGPVDEEGKAVAITVDWSAGYLFIGRGVKDENENETYAVNGPAKLTFSNVNLKSADNNGINAETGYVNGIHVSGEQSPTNANNETQSAKFDGELVIENSDIELSYLVNRHNVTIEKSNVTLLHETGMNVGGRPATETTNGVAATATLTLEGSTLNVNKANIGFEGYGIMNIDSESEVIVSANGQLYAGATGNIKSSGNVSGTLAEEMPDRIELTGGTYTMDVNDFCAVNYAAFTLDNKTWTVRMVKGNQQTALAEGWNWFSSYINGFNGKEGLNMLQFELGENGVEIKNAEDFTFYGEDGKWSGSLEEVNVTESYKIHVSTETSVTLGGDFANYDDIEIVLNPGWNYIGYPVSVETDINVALANLAPAEGDVIKTQGQSASFMFGKWIGGLKVLTPGTGYMYKSADYNGFKYTTVASSSDSSSDKSDATAESKYWNANASQYPSNMTMVAMVNIDGELVNDNYEVAAFANGELRGSARPVYIEELDSYVLILTIQGDKVEELTFKYYDVNYGTEYELDNRINYSNDAVVGSISEPYILTMNITDIDEATLSDVNIYPNPTTTGVQVNLDATCEKVEIFNALGVKVAEYQNVDSIDAFETAGIYVIRLTNGGEIKHTRLVVR